MWDARHSELSVMDSLSWSYVQEILGDAKLSACGKRALDSAFTTFGKKVYELAALARDHAGRKKVCFLI